MDPLDLQLAIGRASVTARNLRTALERLLPGEGELTSLALESLIGQPRKRLESIGLSAAASAALEAPDRPRIARDRAWVERAQVRLIDALSDEYPPLLVEVAAAPAVLYVRGEAAVLRMPQLAMVGSRSPTASGRQTAQEFAAFLAQAGLTITSGLALGIDAASHEGALRAGGRTVAVLGSGLDQLYPPENVALAARIAAQGAVLSEYPPGTPPLRAHFPRRNRLISGLTLGTLVVEATRRSGSLITARLAGEQGREVFAIPGSIHNPLAGGCHQLIKNGAKLVETGQDVLDEFGMAPPRGEAPSRDTALSRSFYTPRQALTASPEASEPVGGQAPKLDKDYKILLDALGFEPSSIDSLVDRTGIASPAVASMLLILELEGTVGLQSDGRYMRLPGR